MGESPADEVNAARQVRRTLPLRSSASANAELKSPDHSTSAGGRSNGMLSLNNSGTAGDAVRPARASLARAWCRHY